MYQVIFASDLIYMCIFISVILKVHVYIIEQNLREHEKKKNTHTQKTGREM